MGLAFTTKSFECAIDGGLAHIVLSQPDRGNPIDGDFCREVARQLVRQARHVASRPERKVEIPHPPHVLVVAHRDELVVELPAQADVRPTRIDDDRQLRVDRAWLFDHLARTQASLVSGGEHVPHELLHSAVSPIVRAGLVGNDSAAPVENERLRNVKVRDEWRSIPVALEIEEG